MRLHSLCSFGGSWAHYFNDIQYSTVYYTFTVRESPAESTVGRKTTPTPLQGERSRRGILPRQGGWKPHLQPPQSLTPPRLLLETHRMDVHKVASVDSGSGA